MAGKGGKDTAQPAGFPNPDAVRKVSSQIIGFVIHCNLRHGNRLSLPPAEAGLAPPSPAAESCGLTGRIRHRRLGAGAGAAVDGAGGHAATAGIEGVSAAGRASGRAARAAEPGPEAAVTPPASPCTGALRSEDPAGSPGKVQISPGPSASGLPDTGPAADTKAKSPPPDVSHGTGPLPLTSSTQPKPPSMAGGKSAPASAVSVNEFPSRRSSAVGGEGCFRCRRCTADQPSVTRPVGRENHTTPCAPAARAAVSNLVRAPGSGSRKTSQSPAAAPRVPDSLT